ncbi:MAG: ATP-binding cassette domain-containing protein [Corallococcus sp.]|nr:ATP-binding cassette domain-containing protein [Corallococcus sp.]
MIEFVNVGKRYHYDQTPTVENFTFTTSERVTTVLMDIQSGKTTLCKLLLGLENADCGSIVVDGVNISETDDKNKSIAYLSENMLLFENKSVLYNVMYPLKIRGINKSPAEIKAKEAIDAIGLCSMANEKVKNLASEERVKTVLARLLVRKPQTVILDDFFNCCDADGLLQTKQLLHSLGCEVLQFTSNVDYAYGDVAVYKDGFVYRGDADGARKAISNLLWLYNIKE